jgi:hypothetical protein
MESEEGMRSKSVVILLVAGMVLSGGVAFIAGYMKGAEDWAGYSAAGEAATTVTKLRDLRANKPELAIRSLEADLDAQIARRDIYESGTRPIKYFLGAGQVDSKLLKDVAEYRRSNPSMSKNEAAQRQIADFLTRY